MLDPIEIKTVDEFCANGNLKDYRSLVVEIFELIKSGDCRLSARYDSHESLHSFAWNPCRIQISLNKIYNDPLEIIWTILHEFGHHKSGYIEKEKLTDPRVQLKRENVAWDFARADALKYPVLKNKISGFEAYRKKCLIGYEKAAETQQDNSG